MGNKNYLVLYDDVMRIQHLSVVDNETISFLGPDGSTVLWTSTLFVTAGDPSVTIQDLHNEAATAGIDISKIGWYILDNGLLVQSQARYDEHLAAIADQGKPIAEGKEFVKLIKGKYREQAGIDAQEIEVGLVVLFAKAASLIVQLEADEANPMTRAKYQAILTVFESQPDISAEDKQFIRAVAEQWAASVRFA